MTDTEKVRAVLHFINGINYCSQGTHHSNVTYQCDQDAYLVVSVLAGTQDVPPMPADRAAYALEKGRELRPATPHPVKLKGKSQT